METANTNPEAKVSENPEEIEEDKKNKTILIKKILFITIGILLLFLIILALVFILKSEEPKESTESAPAIEQTAKENENNTENIPPEPEIKETKFDFNKLEPEKLNEQLELLTNKNMIYQKEKEQKSEKSRLAGRCRWVFGQFWWRRVGTISNKYPNCKGAKSAICNWECESK